MSLTVSGFNEFHEGWLAFLLGEPKRPDGEFYGFGEGWDMASETPSIATVAGIIRKMRSLDQVTVKSETPA